jgi:hypothetical protein
VRVKLILPALTEATSPFFRPIKYSLFPPLGLATLAAYLDTDDDAQIVDEHVDHIFLGPGEESFPGSCVIWRLAAPHRATSRASARSSACRRSGVI